MPSKILIVFDTNRARNLFYGGLRYDHFHFGKDFEELINFISINKLGELVEFGIPELALRELLFQKLEQYKEDRNGLLSIKSRMEKLPNTVLNITLPPDDFNCREHLTPLIKSFLEDNKIKILKIPSQEEQNIFQKILNRSIAGLAPFKGRGNKNSDAGFKDVIIWETLLNDLSLRDYDKIIFFCGDHGFEATKEEFEKVIGKPIMITSSKYFILEELKEDYTAEIKEVELLQYLESKDFSENLRYYLEQNFDFKTDNLDIIKESLEINNFTEDSTDSYGMEELIGQENIKVINLDFISNKEKHWSQVIIDTMTKEIISGGYSPTVL